MLATAPQRNTLSTSDLPSAVRLGWVPEPVRLLPVPAMLAPLLGAGLPRGRVSEVVGEISSGRTSLLLALLAAATAAHEVTAVVDLPNAFDPASAHRAAIDLGGILWVRPPSVREGLRCTELILTAGGFGLVLLDLDGVSTRHLRLYTWPRLARAAERSGAALIVMARQRVAGSFAALSIAMTQRRVLWRCRETLTNRALPLAGTTLFEGVAWRGKLVRNKLGAPGRWGDFEARFTRIDETQP